MVWPRSVAIRLFPSRSRPCPTVSQCWVALDLPASDGALLDSLSRTNSPSTRKKHLYQGFPYLLKVDLHHWIYLSLDLNVRKYRKKAGNKKATLIDTQTISSIFSVNGHPDGFFQPLYHAISPFQPGDGIHYPEQFSRCDDTYRSNSCDDSTQWVGGIAPVLNASGYP